MKAITKEGKVIELRVGQATMGLALTEIRLDDADILSVALNPENVDWFKYLSTRFVPQIKEDNVIPFGGITRLDIDPDRVLSSAVGKVDCIVICGMDKEGNEYFASSMANGADALWYLKRCEKMLLELGDD